MAVAKADTAVQIPYDVLLDMQNKLREQDAMLKKLTSLPLSHATVIAVNPQDASATIAAETQIAEVELDASLGLSVGDPVLINSQTKQIVRRAREPQIGGIGTVKAVISEALSEIIIDGQNRVVINGTSRPKVGDQVVLSTGNMVVYAVMPQEKGQRFVRESLVNVAWDDIGGQSAAKAALQEAIVLPSLYPDLFAHYDKAFPGGILLYGPPGNGKTLLGKASATALKTKGASGAFFAVKGPEVLDAYVGETERKIRDLFKASRTYKAETGNPAVIFIDEAEALLSSRGVRGSVGGMEKTVVPTFLAEMDGIEESSAIVMLATNRPEQLDAAITRDGRMDRKIEVARPNETDAAAVFQVHLRKAPLAKGVTEKVITETVVNAIYFDGAKTDNGKALRDIVSGAMLEGIAEHAKGFALARDLESGGKPTGVTKADALAALRRIQSENSRIAHADH